MKEILLAYKRNANAQIVHLPVPQVGLVFASRSKDRQAHRQPLKRSKACPVFLSGSYFLPIPGQK